MICVIRYCDICRNCEDFIKDNKNDQNSRIENQCRKLSRYYVLMMDNLRKKSRRLNLQ